jgi:2-polyprenyl-3-methyl-5-hydroxy-6-metoxy-1,4-benzoquinol methylase
MGFYNVQGLETSKEQGEKCIENGLNVSIVSDSIKWLEIRNDEFDVILLLDVLEHVPVESQIILLKNIYNSLKKKG